MSSPHKTKLLPRRDLKARVVLAGLDFTTFARQHRFNRATVYAVLDGRRTSGPVAKRIIERVAALTPNP